MEQESYCQNGHMWDTFENQCPKCNSYALYKHKKDSFTGICEGIKAAGPSVEVFLVPERVVNPRLILYRDLIDQLYVENNALTNQAAVVIETLLLDLYKKDCLGR